MATGRARVPAIRSSAPSGVEPPPRLPRTQFARMPPFAPQAPGGPRLIVRVRARLVPALLAALIAAPCGARQDDQVSQANRVYASVSTAKRSDLVLLPV